MPTSLLSAILLAAAAISACAQCPTPGSDGDLTIAANLGRILFDPVARNIGDPNNVFCFTSVTVGSNSTLVFHSNSMRNPNSPVFFYVTGAVTFSATAGFDLSGETGALELTFPAINTGGLTTQQEVQLRRPSIPGPGGFPGGLGLSGGVLPEAGGGPGGGQPGTAVGGSSCNGAAAAHFGPGNDFSTGSPFSRVTYANANLMPMYGGSGGGGGGGNSSAGFGGMGGAGGGAIRIVAASFSFAGSSFINASGGSANSLAAGMACAGGGGSGGSIHLVAPAPIPTLGFLALDVTGHQGGNGSFPNLGGSGLIRISTGNTSCNCNGNAVFGPSFVPPIQTGTPNLRITSIGGQAVPVQPSGSYLTPDVTLATNSPVTIQISANNIPVATVVTLRITNEANPDQIISCQPLAGSLATATASCSATYAQLGSMSSIRAVW